MKTSTRILNEIIKKYHKLGILHSNDITILQDKITLFDTYTLSYLQAEIQKDDTNITFNLSEVSKVSNKNDSVFVELENGTYYLIDTPNFLIFSDILKEILYSHEQFYIALTSDDLFHPKTISTANLNSITTKDHIISRIELLSYIETKQFSKAEHKLPSLYDYSTIDVLYYSSLINRSDSPQTHLIFLVY